MKKTLLFFLVLLSCEKKEFSSDGKPEIDSLALELNEKAINRFQNYNLGLNNEIDSLELSIIDLDSALRIEPKNSVFYSNKATILLALNRDEEVLELMQSAIKEIPSYAEGYSMIGFIYEYRKNSEKSQMWFKKALNAYDDRIEQNKFVVNSKLNKAFLYFFTDGKEAATREFEKLKNEYPDDNNVLYMGFVFDEFDKESYLREMLDK